MKRIILYFFILFPLWAFPQESGQNSVLQRVIPPSPQAAAFARYGEYPVSHSTGVPSISIPLYEIELGDYKLPISLSYHASGIRVDDIASPVGLGWVLNAGGLVTRLIKGTPDLGRTSLSLNDTLYRSHDKIVELLESAQSTSLNIERVLDIVNKGYSAEYDIESDRYAYNFNGKTGIFRYSHKEKEFITLNNDPIYIEATYGDESSFYIVDSDGVVYYFEGREYVGVSDDEDITEISSWYLTKIVTPKGEISFNYINTERFSTYNWSYSAAIGCFCSQDKSGHFAFDIQEWKINMKNNKYRTKYIHSELLLSSIIWGGNRVEFTYMNDREDIAPCRLDRINIFNANGDLCKDIVFYLSSASC